MTSTQQPVSILHAEWLKTGVIVHFTDGISACFTSDFLLQHRNDFFIPEDLIEDIP